MANRRKEFSYSCRELSWKAHGVDANVISTNTHSIGSVVIGCLFRVTKKLQVIIDDNLLPSRFPEKNASCNASRVRNLTETLFV